MFLALSYDAVFLITLGLTLPFIGLALLLIKYHATKPKLNQTKSNRDDLTMTFEDALIKLKAGHQVARKIWVDLRILSANHIVIQLTDDEYAADDYEFQASDYDTDSLDAEYEDYLDEFGYTASSNDLLATDWVHGHRTKITP